ncbi:aminoglycoside phosphotransferase family protein [Pseudophaeobacter sp. 1A09344]|jgi:streptomycin 6-kinase|uniref:aminoglycoside phosphotransferase family protein n=1 Tax=Rhodobacterales TaxID=204455 RepID=UPI00321D730C
MKGHVKPPEEVLAAFRVTVPEWIATTAIASLWKVSRAGGGAAVLKYYGARGMGSEASGFRFLQAAPESCAAQVYDLRPDAALVEWLEGPSLADVAIAGEDEMAARELVRVASGLHPGTGQAPEGYPRLEDRFDALFHLRPAPSCAAGGKAAIAACQTLARDLLDAQVDVRPLHGDLHHGNVMKTPRGFCAFDAKGIVGERTYELANAFRHPYGDPDLIRDPRRIGMLADLWATGFAVDRQRLLQWAAVKCALSIAWRSKGRLAQDAELDLLAALLYCASGPGGARV